MYRFWLFLCVFCVGCGQSRYAEPDAKVNLNPSPASIGLFGDPIDVKPSTRAGFLLAGGSEDSDEAMRWLAARANGGDLVVLRASGSTGYNQYWYDLAKPNSVETLLINTKELASDPYVLRRVKEAEGIFIAGGDQANYIKFWKDTPLEDALNDAILRKVPIGGTSAGNAVLGEVIFDALNDTIKSEDALKNPYHPAVSLTNGGFLNIPILRATLTDTHYSQRERQGRHVVFLARMLQDFGKTVQGIGVDEETAVAIDEDGVATVFGKNEAYFILKNKGLPEKCKLNQSLTWSQNQTALRAYVIKGSLSGHGRFDLKNWEKPNEAGGLWKSMFVEDGILQIRP